MSQGQLGYEGEYERSLTEVKSQRQTKRRQQEIAQVSAIALCSLQARGTRTHYWSLSLRRCLFSSRNSRRSLAMSRRRTHCS